MGKLNGSILNKKYLMMYPIGEGGYSYVWLAYDMESGTSKAVKIH